MAAPPEGLTIEQVEPTPEDLATNQVRYRVTLNVCPHGYWAPLNCGLCAGIDG